MFHPTKTEVSDRDIPDASLRSFIVEHKITMACEWSFANPCMDLDEWSRKATHWKCTLKGFGRRMTVYFSQGAAINGEPVLVDVLNCVASDAAGFENAPNFEDWCSDYGYDTDSRKAERTYKIIQREAGKLRAFIGDPLVYDTLLFKTDRE